MNQLERAQALIQERFRGIAAVKAIFDSDAFKALELIMSEAQNGPPLGAADGSINEETWNAIMEAVRSIRQIKSACERLEKCFDTILAAGAFKKMVKIKRLSIPIKRG